MKTTHLKRDPYAVRRFLERNIPAEKRGPVVAVAALLEDHYVEPEAEEALEHLLHTAAKVVLRMAEAQLRSVATEDEIREVLQRAEAIILGEQP